MLNETLTKLGITNIKELPKKTQMKIADYVRLTSTPIGNDKEGNPTPKKLIRLESLVEDVIFEAKLFLKHKGQQQPENKNDPPTETVIPATETVIPAAEIGTPAAKPATSTAKPATPPLKPATPPVEREGFLKNLWGW